MLQSQSQPDIYSPSPSFPNTLLHNNYCPQMGFDAIHPSSSDPSAVDFRAFYPYTPNEVKHRKRTTSAQLKVLETVFKRDTKPNATLRNELAAQLEMTARGVQVWFQNRRAKEKTKSSKVSGSKGPSPAMSSSPLSQSSDLVKQEDAPSPLADSMGDVEQKPVVLPQGSVGRADASKPILPPLTTPPQLHLITDPSNPAWLNSPVEPPPDSATFASHRRPSLFTHTELYSHRRGSLPVNVVFPPSADLSLQSPSSVEWFDPLTRRRSVDASLQRLAHNPYAPLARTKNTALFGPRFGVASPGRQHQLSRVPYNHANRPSLTHYPSVPHVNIRRSSMDSRNMRLSLRTTALSPAPIGTPYINSRASLPDSRLYAMSSRPIRSPIPGPLPSPNFSFGAASTPSMASPSSADSERNSPDSLGSFSYPQGEDHEDDGGLSPTYEPYSRFGSMVSIATSESSINSYFSELGGPRMDQALTGDLQNTSGRRNSCSPQQFLEFNDLDSSAQYDMAGDHPLGMPGYPQDEYGITRPQGIAVSETASNSYPSPASTISARNSPHALGAASVAVPLSRSSELAYALQGSSEQPTSNAQKDQYLLFNEQSSPQTDQTSVQPSSECSNGTDSNGLYHHQANDLSPQGQYTTFSALSDVYADGQTTAQLDASLYQAYNESLNMSTLSPIDNGVQNVEAFAAYT